ncbi:universal stress protein [Natrarchaeobius chitinivorans]|uniref:Universal stress protein n=1 Tax=Natrarchaeobius chitinivorans TaxID=1679083 RepID=A0A3N6LXH6_NATCH|nr:universal stress protein [Natrarchaeobius chitinivorans]RQG95488.1 universal stress protein [Natrarchaeobius chitinivorans]
MPRSILVPHDGSSSAQTALRYAIETFPDARIVLFHAIDPFEVTPGEEQLPPLTDEWLEDQRSSTTALFEDARASLEVDEVTIETETGVGSPAQTIVAAVEETDADQIVMGSRGKSGAPGLRMGSTAELVVKRADVPVTVVR